MDKLFTVREFAEMVKISRAKAYKIIKDYGIELLKLGPRSSRITQDQIEFLIEKMNQELINNNPCVMLVLPAEEEIT